MYSFLRLAIRGAIIFVLLFAVVQVFNRFCNFDHSCRPFYFSRYLPRIESDWDAKMSFAVFNSRQNLDFEVSNPSLEVSGNQINSVYFKAKNSSERNIGFKPIFETTPKFYAKYIKRLQCPCSEKFLLKPGEEVNMEMEFYIDRAIENDPEFKRIGHNNIAIAVTYRIE